MMQDDGRQADVRQATAAGQATAEQATATGSGGGRGLLAAWAAWEPKKRSALVRLSLCLLLGLLLMLWARQPLARSLGWDDDNVSSVSNVSSVNGDISNISNISDVNSDGSLNVNNINDPGAATADALEQELAAILSQVKGAGQVTVAVWYAAGESAVYAQQSQTAHSQSPANDGGTASTVEESLSPAVVGEGPLLLRQEAAVVQGVLVVAPGAGDAAVQERLYRALQGLLGLDMAQIAVIEAAQ